MNELSNPQDIYQAVEQLISDLKLAGCSVLAGILEHRMHQVAWTDRAELMEELHSVISRTLQAEDENLPKRIRYHLSQVSGAIANYLRKGEE